MNKYIFAFIMIIVLYVFMRTIMLSTLHYKNYIVLKDIFSKEEINKIQCCIGNTSSEIGECFIECQSIILHKIKEKLGVNYMHIGLARLSNNNNNDAQSFHRDIKPAWGVTGKYPNVYTIVCYFDEAKLSMGNETIHSNPGDVIIFNSTNLHKANNIDIFDNNRQRRVFQYYHVLFDINQQNSFYKNHSFCEHIDGTEIMKYVTYYFDIKFMFEYFNAGRFINTTKCNTLFMTNIKRKTYLTTIDGIDYYQYF